MDRVDISNEYFYGDIDRYVYVEDIVTRPKIDHAQKSLVSCKINYTSYTKWA